MAPPDTDSLRSLEEYTKTVEDDFKALKSRIEREVNTRLLFLYSHLKGRNIDGYSDLLREMLDHELESAHEDILKDTAAAREEIIASGIAETAVIGGKKLSGVIAGRQSSGGGR